MTIRIKDARGKYVTLTPEAILEASREAIDLKFKRGMSFTSPDTSKNFLQAKLVGQEREIFAVLFLDTKHRLLAYEEMFFGTIDGSEVHPRVVMKRALEVNAAAMIISHNHPSGDPSPSAADRALTKRLKETANLLDIRVLDHVIIGSYPYSMAEAGLV